MSSRDVAELVRGLEALEEWIPRLKRLLPDLYSLAYERHVGDRGRGGGLASELNPLVGSQAAKDAWRECAQTVDHMVKTLESRFVGVAKVLSAGESADVSLRGTLLGDEGRGAAAELAELVGRQRDRRERGEYVPARDLPQPQVPRR